MRSIEAGNRIVAGQVTLKLLGEFPTGWGKSQRLPYSRLKAMNEEYVKN